ncbi:hypothetical protein [Streptomyces malaysiensis]|uniref:Translation elongation factor G n=1 Tax=Streptomyces malaysiensis TaxID=92644 RepID=A0A7X6AU82_STRMQ|nr:hypothetical protein [Streptomyces malaysiensis]NIY62603.1 translation elongation factor G [Streptomyces malaysiensis]
MLGLPDALRELVDLSDEELRVALRSTVLRFLWCRCGRAERSRGVRLAAYGRVPVLHA